MDIVSQQNGDVEFRIVRIQVEIDLDGFDKPSFKGDVELQFRRQCLLCAVTQVDVDLGGARFQIGIYLYLIDPCG